MASETDLYLKIGSNLRSQQKKKVEEEEIIKGNINNNKLPADTCNTQ